MILGMPSLIWAMTIMVASAGHAPDKRYQMEVVYLLDFLFPLFFSGWAGGGAMASSSGSGPAMRSVKMARCPRPRYTTSTPPSASSARSRWPTGACSASWSSALFPSWDRVGWASAPRTRCTTPTSRRSFYPHPPLLHSLSPPPPLCPQLVGHRSRPRHRCRRHQSPPPPPHHHLDPAVAGLCLRRQQHLRCRCPLFPALVHCRTHFRPPITATQPGG